MASYRSDIAATIKELLTADEVARRYGFEPDRSGFIRCPFHKGDRHGSLKLYPGRGGWHCFGCQRGGSVIDFVMELYGIGFAQAVTRLNFDFKLDLTASKPDPTRRSEILALRNAEARKDVHKRFELHRLAREHCYWLEASKVFAPTAPGFIHPVYAEAVKRLDWLDYITDVMIRGEDGEDGWTNNGAGAGAEPRVPAGANAPAGATAASTGAAP